MLFAETSERTVYEFTRLYMMGQWWHWLALLATCIAISVLVGWLYRRDSVELRRGVRWTLLVLRITAFAGLLFYFLNLEKKTEQLQTKNSRVAVLVDTSQSMGITDVDSSGNRENLSRIEQVRQSLASSDAISRLREQHDVLLYTFSESATPASIATLGKTRTNTEEQADPAQVVASAASESRVLWTVAAVGLAIGVVAVLLQIALGSRVRGAEGESWFLLAATVIMIAAFVVAGIANVRQPRITPAMVFGWQPLPERLEESGTTEDTEAAPADPTIDWATVLAARGVETRAGDAIRSVTEQERGGPIAGIVVITDGAANAGLDLAAASQFSQQANVAVFPVGLGSDKLPTNTRVVDVEAPARVFPGDNFTVKAYLQATGVNNRRLVAKLMSSTEANDDETSVAVTEQQEDVILTDGKVATVEFEVTPDQIGKRTYSIELQSVPAEINKEDNRASASVEIIERKTRMLLFAGGPTREYRFLRNQLFRDKETTVDILLQTAVKATSQEADKLLEDFPSSPEEMFEYDCLMAFDPDWSQLDNNQLQLIERWVSEKAGGIIAIAGPVHMPAWTRDRRGDPRLTPIRSLYPVTFYSRVASSIQIGRSKSDTPWPLELTDAGRSAPFMDLSEDDTKPATAAWDDFEGVYGFYAAKDVKPGATVYARFSDPQTKVNDSLPVYIADQFYGAGRVAYLASGEMWRLRAYDDSHFQRFYTKLIRHVSQGRLLRDSSRGILLVDKERCTLGENVVVRAVLSNAQFDPLQANKVDASILLPNGLRAPLTLLPAKQEAGEGVFVGQFTALQDGDTLVELPVPDSENEILTREIRVRVPQLEIERPQRNDAELASLADATGGTYYVGMNAAFDEGGDTSLFTSLKSMDQETYLPGSSDDAFQQRLMSWLLALICGTLCLEWIIRRLSKLA